MSKSNVKHKLALRRVFKPKGWKFEGIYFTSVHHINDLPAVYGIAGKSVGMPSQNAVGLAGIDNPQHFTEHGSARLFGSFCLAKRGDDFKFFFGGKFF
ncbi:MAG: hypothetical protein AAB797_02225 [Patescibacteria group bacterium]